MTIFCLTCVFKQKLLNGIKDGWGKKMAKKLHFDVKSDDGADAGAPN